MELVFKLLKVTLLSDPHRGMCKRIIIHVSFQDEMEHLFKITSFELMPTYAVSCVNIVVIAVATVTISCYILC